MKLTQYFRILKSNKGESEKSGKRSSFLLALFSVFVALLLWFYVQDAEAPNYKKTFSNVPLEMQSLSTTFSVISGGDGTVDITLVGKRSDLNKLRSSDLEAYVDLSSVTQPGTYQKEIQVLVPNNAEYSGSFPQLVSVVVDQTISVSTPVVIELGDYTIGKDLGLEATSAATEIEIKGPKSLLENIQCAKVKTGNLGEITSSFESNLEYELVDKNGSPIHSRYVITPEKNVLVRFSLYKTKSIPLTVDTKNGYWKEGDYEVSVSPEKILVKGDPAIIDTLSSIPAITVDETLVDSSRYSQTLSPAALKLPDGVVLAETLGEIKVNVNLSQYASRNLKTKLDANNVAITPPSGLKYSFEEKEISFKIRGKQEKLGTAKAEDFYLNIDLSEIVSEGTYEVSVQITPATAIEENVYVVGRYTVKVKASEIPE